MCSFNSAKGMFCIKHPNQRTVGKFWFNIRGKYKLFWLIVKRFWTCVNALNLLLAFFVTEADLERVWRARTLLLFYNCLLFCNHLEELQTLSFEVVLIIINATLTFVYPNPIQTCWTPNYLLFCRQLLYSCNRTSTIVTNLTVHQ